MSDPLNRHPPLPVLFPDQWSSNLADTGFSPTLQLPIHQLEPLVLSDADVGAYDWASIIREMGAPGIPGAGPQYDMSMPLPSAGPQNDAPPPFSPSQHPTSLQQDICPAFDAFERGADASASISDASAGHDQAGDNFDALSGAEFTMDHDPDIRDPKDEVHFGSLRIRPKVPKAELPRIRATGVVNRGKKLVAEEEALKMKASWDRDIAVFNEKHGYAPDFVHSQLGLSQTIKTTRGPCASNGLNSRASDYFNSGEYFWAAT